MDGRREALKVPHGGADGLGEGPTPDPEEPFPMRLLSAVALLAGMTSSFVVLPTAGLPAA